jgi:hypothetical protein
VKVGEDERPYLVAEARALAQRLADPAVRRPYEEVASGAEAGEVPEEWAGLVATLVELSLETGRAREVYGPAGVRALLALWRRTPRALELEARLEELNRALSALRGRPVRGVSVSAAGPGTYAVRIAAGDDEVRLLADRAGVRLRSIEVGGGGIGE